ncbi:exonuclease [Acanthamoeba polyphaga moumouvirus]|uniref:Exodeoxyribonuclease VII large subuni n=2 Tax=Moumouvirus TaxID=3080801 RepID=L7RDW5_9VIRU|nr:exonuclease [Acanthamoeba polyphaga moumouvirus]AEX62357.1 exodeoxyribonuclease 7 large subunit [Moumouvirus Monve]AGC02293.1 exodeoxyribonuclease VII large subuni [Acanthamoeba polyphaga moumouvirus]AQN68635.1 exodeoxyribonuclease VIi large subuni [Saudi moumouvirus]
MSDIDIDNIEFLSETENNHLTISIIYDIIKVSIDSSHLFQNINLVAEVIDIRNYKGMVFIKIRDISGVMPAVIYRNVYKEKLLEGDKINIVGKLDIYNSQIQLIINSYKKTGLGDTNLKLQLLKEKLFKLGYLDNKPILENDYKKIGVISSINAAGLRDFLHVIIQRCTGKQLYIYPASVQGKEAPNEIISAIKLANEHKIVDIIVLIRGGGSREDLACFNDEGIAHAIYQSKIPIVTGIGHQIDTSIADLVCVKSFITPTAVAQNITIENNNSKNILNELTKSINQKIINYLGKRNNYLIDRDNKLKNRIDNLISHLDNTIESHNNTIINKKQHLVTNINNTFKYISDRNKEIHDLISNNVNILENKLDNDQNKFSYYLNTFDQKINIYDNQLKFIARPEIFNNSGECINSLQELKNNKYITINFIDGVYHLKIQ